MIPAFHQIESNQACISSIQMWLPLSASGSGWKRSAEPPVFIIFSEQTDTNGQFSEFPVLGKFVR
jgi:hypothetical protein